MEPQFQKDYRPGTNASDSPWLKPGAVDMLLELAKDGLSAAKISQQLCENGVFVSRNGVIGKLVRMNIKLRELKPQKIKPKPVKREKSNRPSVPDDDRAFKKRLQLAFCGEGQPLDTVLTRNLCRWPLTTGFCGHELEDNQPYCSKHCDMAYTSRLKSAA